MAMVGDIPQGAGEAQDDGAMGDDAFAFLESFEDLHLWTVAEAESKLAAFEDFTFELDKGDGLPGVLDQGGFGDGQGVLGMTGGQMEAQTLAEAELGLGVGP